MSTPKLIAFIVLYFAVATSAQMMGGGKRIQGQIRLDGSPAPQGVLVLLDRARGRDSSFVNGSGELSNTMTDSRGKFSFENIDAGQEHPEGKIYVISARYPGYRNASQIVDLTSNPIGYVDFDLRRDTSREVPNVPKGGPGAMISANQPSSGRAQEELARGEELLIEKRDPNASIKSFKKVIELEPQYSPGHILLGTAYMQVRQWENARSAFEKAAKLDSGNSSAFLGIGAALNQLQDFSGAIKPLTRSLELNASSAEAQYEIGRSLWGLKKWQDAEPHAHKSLQINNELAPAHILMGNIYLRRRDANSALKEFQEYLRLDPQGDHVIAVREMIDKIQKAVGQR